MPKISVVITVYNRTQCIIQAIQSVLAQTYRDFEIIVVDDGSNIDIKETLKPYQGKIKFIYQENRGLAAARNTGIRHAQGEYIAFLDDDLWAPQKLEVQIPILENNPDLGFVCSEVLAMDEKGNVLAKWRKFGDWELQDTFEDLYEGNFVHVPTVVARKDCLQAIGGFDESLRSTEDYECWLRLAKRYRFLYINQPLAKYRLHSQQVSKNPDLYDLRIRNNIKVLMKEEIAGELSFVKKHIRKAKVYYQYAKLYYSHRLFLKAGINYVKTILTFSLIGSCYWPKEARNWRFSFLYRVLKVYFLAVLCFLLALREKNAINPQGS